MTPKIETEPKEHIGYKVEVGGDFDIPIWFMGFITYFDGTEIIITSSNRFDDKQDAWKWIGDTLASWENK